MRFHALVPMLQTANLQQTIDWYGNILGFSVAHRMEGWCTLMRDAVKIMFMSNAHLGMPHATATQYIYVDDVWALWAAIEGHCHAEWGPGEMPYGMIEFAIKDPNGYLLSFGQRSDRRL